MATVEQSVPPLIEGQRLSRDEFMRRWEAMPDVKFAELLGGVVYMPSPLSLEHGESDLPVAGWLAHYQAATPGIRGGINTTWLLLEDAPQPDTHLRILPEYGGKARVDGEYGSDSVELLVEVSKSSKRIDLGIKKELYRDAGVDEYIVVLEELNEVRWHRLVSGQYQLLPQSPEGITRSIVYPGLWLNVPALLAGDLAQVLVTLGDGLKSPEHAAFVEELAKRKAKA